MNVLKTIFHGIFIGAGMSIPGCSGGTLAMMLGIYNSLLSSVSELLSDFKKNILFLLNFTVGACIGLLLSATIISKLLSTAAAVPLRYAFLGMAAGCIPSIIKETKLSTSGTRYFVPIITGAAIAFGISQLPSGIFDGSVGGCGVIIQFCGGLIVSAALVLPGISASQMLYSLGMYENVMYSIAEYDILSIAPFAVGVFIGTFATAKLVSKLITRYASTYLVILGFMVFSLFEMIPDTTSYAETALGIICTVIGFSIISLCTKKECKNHDIVAKTT